MSPDEPTDEEQLEQLPQDGQTPFSPADPPQDAETEADDDYTQPAVNFDDTHPATDSNIDDQEAYDTGIASAAEMRDPDQKNSVLDYDPDAPESDENSD